MVEISVCVISVNTVEATVDRGWLYSKEGM